MNTVNETKHEIQVHELGLQPYEQTWQAMRAFTDNRNSETSDQLWLVEHFPVFTQGQAGKPEHLLSPGDIPVVHTDRGGQVTYHGPGQLVAYSLFDIKRREIGIRSFVRAWEQTIITFLASYHIQGHTRNDAPGVYVNNAKICSIGLRIRRGFSYHGIAFNVKMDLSPFKRINPCGFKGLSMTQLSHWVPNITMAEVIPPLLNCLATQFNSHILRGDQCPIRK